MRRLIVATGHLHAARVEGAAPRNLLSGRGHAGDYSASASPAGQEKVAGMDHSWKAFVSSTARK